MNRFSWYDAKHVEEALREVNATVSQTLQPDTPADATVFKSGGVDLLDLMKEGLCEPKKIVNIKNIEGLDLISYDTKRGVRIGANVTLSQIAADVRIQSDYRALHLSANTAGTPQIRNMSSLGGNLVQRTRCWYFRSKAHPCLRKGGSTCFARNGENAYHAILDNHLCVSVHASSIATALMAFAARVEIAGRGGRRREVSIEQFFVRPEEDIRRETILDPKEMITAVIIPPVTPQTRSYYISQGEKASHDWALADTAVVMEFSGNTCRNAVIVLGAVAPVPLKLESAAQVLRGEPVNEKIAAAAAESAMEASAPLAKNSYKVPLCKALIKRAILKSLQI